MKLTLILGMVEKMDKSEVKDFLGETRFRMNNYTLFIPRTWLTEAYKKSNDVDWVEVLRLYKDCMRNEVSEKDFTSYLDKNKIAFEIVDGEGLIGGQFELSTQRVIMVFTKDIEEEIFYANESMLKNLAANFWINFIHEDTHRQQFNAAGDYNIFKKYKAPATLDWTADLMTNLDYYDQSVEADAYGRDVGARLQTKFGKRSNFHTISLISSDRDVNDDYCQKLISIYKDPRISKKSHIAFFRALYDFLSENEL